MTEYTERRASILDVQKQTRCGRASVPLEEMFWRSMVRGRSKQRKTT